MDGRHATRLDRLPAKRANAVRREDGPRELTFVERTTLFVCALHRERALDLIEGFAERPRGTARSFARQVMDWDSSTRQARITRELGSRPDAAERLRALIVEATPLLRQAIAAILPPAQRALFPHLDDKAAGGALAPAVRALAERLVREAVR